MTLSWHGPDFDTAGVAISATGYGWPQSEPRQKYFSVTH